MQQLPDTKDHQLSSAHVIAKMLRLIGSVQEVTLVLLLLLLLLQV
jgi:hypothetical protein